MGDVSVPSVNGAATELKVDKLSAPLKIIFWSPMYPPSVSYKDHEWGFPEAESSVFNGDRTNPPANSPKYLDGYWPLFRMATDVPFNCKE